ncbi:MAG: lipopolysaccharide heptosyltransferase I [Phycisphaerales bacterium]|nr:lipopolysaccharide heptosyltransferase I [Phycisphaerales bacterium]
MGDVVHALPAVCALRQRFPSAQLSWLVDPRFAAIVNGHPAIDRVIVAPSTPLIARWPRSDLLRATVQYSLAPRLRRENFDRVIDLQGLFRTGVLTAATGARQRIGFANAREGAAIFYTRRHWISRDLHAVDRCLKLVESLGAAGPVRYDLSPTPAACEQAGQLLKQQGIVPGSPYLVFCPRSANPIKEWPAGRFAELAREIWKTLHLPVVLMGTRADEPLARQIADQAGRGVFVLTGTSLSISMAIIAGSRLMVANDSGPLHLAVALGRPVVGIYGPTDPVRTGPYGHPDQVVRDNSNCDVCRRPRWRVPGHTCLINLPVERVLAAVKQRLDCTS